jgi:hypothetical protein
MNDKPPLQEDERASYKSPLRELSEQHRYFYAVFRALLLTLSLHLLACLAFFSLGFPITEANGKPGEWLSLFGFIQLLYMIPVIGYFNRRGRHAEMIGLVIGAALTFLIGLPYAYACATQPIHPFSKGLDPSKISTI